MGVSSGNGRASKAQWPTGSIPVTLARGMYRAVRERIHRRSYTGERQTCSASGSTMECSLPPHLPETLEKEGERTRPYIPLSLSPATSTFPPFDEAAGHKLLGSRVLLVVAAPPGRSEQNRSSPPPLTLNGESEGIFFFVLK